MNNQELAKACTELRLSNMANIAKLNQFPEDDKSAWLLGLLKRKLRLGTIRRLPGFITKQNFQNEKP